MEGEIQGTLAPDAANLPPLPEGWCWATLERNGIGPLVMERQKSVARPTLG